MADRDNQFFSETGRSTRVFLRIVLRVNIIIIRLARRRNKKNIYFKNDRFIHGYLFIRLTRAVVNYRHYYYYNYCCNDWWVINWIFYVIFWVIEGLYNIGLHGFMTMLWKFLVPSYIKAIIWILNLLYFMLSYVILYQYVRSIMNAAAAWCRSRYYNKF